MKINVAITLNISDDPQQSIWYNGANQNCFFLYQLLRKSPLVDHVWLVHSDGIKNYPAGLLMGDLQRALRPISSVLDKTDLLVEMNGFVSQEQVERVRRRKGKAVSFRFGNDYVIAVETMTFGRDQWQPNPHRVTFDELWTNPQHVHTCKSYWESVYKAPVHVLPHIWAPYFIEAALAANPELRQKWGYRNHGSAKRVAIFEPNINVVKSTLIPMLAANQFYIEHPGLLAHVFMTNTFQLKENSAFKHLALGLEIVKDGKATADHRFPFCAFAAEHTDIVISHQWENGLNYLFYDALYGGYPLVHNSPFLSEAGYYYRDFDVADGARALAEAALSHDENSAAYAAKAQAFLHSVDATAEANIAAYTQRIGALFGPR